MIKYFSLIVLTAGLLSPIPAEAFWGLTKEESRICRERASQENNEFSAKQTYRYCKSNIKKEMKGYRDSYMKKKKEQERKSLEAEKWKREQYRLIEEEKRLFREKNGEDCRKLLERNKSDQLGRDLKNKPVDELTEKEQIHLDEYRKDRLYLYLCKQAGAI
tara:strand:+ start:27 stop:509 length:483 start_codon:yes stop_codon:yes gene_type:complete